MRHLRWMALLAALIPGALLTLASLGILIYNLAHSTGHFLDLPAVCFFAGLFYFFLAGSAWKTPGAGGILSILAAGGVFTMVALFASVSEYNRTFFVCWLLPAGIVMFVSGILHLIFWKHRGGRVPRPGTQA